MPAYKHINKYNYEAWFLDFHEGKLTVDEQELLFVFVEQNPEMAEQLFDYQEPKTADIELESDFQDFLKKPLYEHAKEITTQNLNDFLIAETEGLLTNKQVLLLDKYILQNQSAAKERKLYALTRQEPDYTIVFENKQSLKRGSRPVLARIGSRIVRLRFIEVSAAAILLAAVIIFLPRNNTPSLVLNEPEKQTQQPVRSPQSTVGSPQLMDGKKPETKNKELQTIPAPQPKKNIVKERPIFIKEVAPEKMVVAKVETSPAKQLPLEAAKEINLPKTILPLPETAMQELAFVYKKGNLQNLMLGVNRITGIQFFTPKKHQLKVDWMNVAKATAKFLKRKTGRSISIGNTSTMSAFR